VIGFTDIRKTDTNDERLHGHDYSRLQKEPIPFNGNGS